MKNFFFLMSLISLLSLRADANSVAFKGEWIYFRPTLDSPYFAAETTSVDDAIGLNASRRIKNAPHYHSGYRVEGSYTFEEWCSDFVVSWTDLKESYSRNVQGQITSEITPTTNTFFDSATATSDFHYYSWDVQIRRTLFDSECIDFRGFIGLQFGAVNLKEDYFFARDLPLDQEAILFHRSFRGTGPELGFCLDYFAGWGFSLKGSALGGALLARSHFNSFSNVQQSVNTQTGILFDPLWRCIPFWDVRLSLAHESCLRGFLVSFEIGYEGLGYIEALPQLNDAGRIDVDQRLRYSDVCFNGPFIAVAVRY